MNASEAGARIPKNICLFSDGTGNSSAKLFKTNVWRLYRAVDVLPPATPGDVRQIVKYDDGVGTSTFKPFALLGGALGVGLKRNTLELYQFVCRNYEQGDRIYAFGFSRGAFTIRVLVGLLTTVGIIDARSMDQATLDALSEDAYRDLRRCFRLGGNRDPVNAPQENKRDRTDIFVTPLRDLQVRRIARKRKRAGLPLLSKEHMHGIPDITFVGVWDTVAAYGSPFAEITKGIDRWVWPLSMPDYKLSVKVKCARHALALDDERDTFHPLLWDEVHERKLLKSNKVEAERVRQVWFAGMHSDVGGGYAEESLACVSLDWMAREATGAGLRLRPGARTEFRAIADPLGPMHDSRAGLAAYYRYQPRKISARLARPDPTTRIVQDPDFKGRGLLTTVRIHDSVLERIENGDGYAPIVLPGEYEVEDGSMRERHAAERAAAQEKAWDQVWRRRVHYFLTVGLTLGLLVLAILPKATSTCIGPQCVISPWLRALGEWLPEFATAWIDKFAARPGLFLVLVLSILWLLRKTGRIELEMRDFMRKLYRLSIPAQAGSPADAKAQIVRLSGEAGRVRRLRSNKRYQKNMQYLKWQALPGVAAIVLWAASIVLGVTLLSSVVNITHRTHIALAERTEAFCDRASTPPSDLFATSDMCWRGAGEVEKDLRYRLRMQVVEPWHDGTLAASPIGFDARRFPWLLRWPATLLRRSTSDPWFRPLIHVEGHTVGSGALKSVPMKLTDYERQIYVGEFTAPASGPLVLSVNDSVFLWTGRPDYFYTGDEGLNRGTARVTVEACQDALKPLEQPCDFVDVEH